MMASAAAAMEGCTQSFGFLPCSTNAWGGLFLALVYGYLVLRGAVMIGDGGEWLMELKLAPAVIGGLVLPIIGALPDALIIINSGLHESRSQAREEIAVGMGTLAGSTVMLLTLVWGGSVWVGRCDLDPSTGLQRDGSRDRPWWDITRTGVSTDEQAPRSAWAMLAAAMLFVFVQVTAMLTPHEHPKLHGGGSLAGCILCFIGLAVYCGYQVWTPAAQRRRALAVHKHALRCRAVRSFSFAAQRFGGLLGPDGAVRREVTSRIFHRFRRDEGGCLDADDIRAMLIGLEIARPAWHGAAAAALSGRSIALSGVSRGAALSGVGNGAALSGGSAVSCMLGGKILEDHVSLWMREFDRRGTGRITEDMFHEGVSRWVSYKMRRSPLRLEPKFQKAQAKDPAAAAQQLLVHVDDISTPLLVEIPSGSASGSDTGEPLTDDPETDLESGEYGCSSPRGGGRGSGSGGSGSGTGSGGSKEDPPPAWLVGTRAAVLLAAGTALCAFFSDPLVGSVTDLSRATGVPPFFIAFVFMPLASNASELVSSLAFAAGQTSQRISVTFNQVYGAVVMNSTLCLGAFLGILYGKRLPWTFTSETIVILAPTLVLGWFAARRRSWRAAWGLGAAAMYPLALLLQFVLMRVGHLG